MRYRRLTKLLWIAAIAILGLFAIRTFYGDVYRVTSDSMVPTLRPGEYVFVRFDSDDVRRGDLVVHLRGGETVVKRAMGLGGEEVVIARDGDLLIDKRRAGGDVARVLLFDADRHSVEEHFNMGGTNENPWKQNEQLGGWELDARQIERGRSSGLLRLREGVRDGYLMPEGARVYGVTHVGDISLELEMYVVESTGRVRAALIEQADTFEISFELDGAPPGSAHAVLTRLGEDVPRIMDERDVVLEPGAWTRLFLENVNNVVRVELGDIGWSVPYERNVRHPKDRTGDGLSIGERARFGGEGCHLVVRSLRVWRDLHYLARGDFGVGKPLDLDRNQLFVLGDNSARSRDSRDWGPLRRSDVRGRATWVVWPPSAIRRLPRAAR